MSTHMSTDPPVLSADPYVALAVVYTGALVPDALAVVPSSSTEVDKIHVAGKDFSIRSGFSSWNIKTIGALAVEYPSDGAISSTIGPHETMQHAMTSITIANNRSFGVKFSIM